MERTMVLIKPDGVERNIIGNIISCYEANGLKIKELKMMKATREIAEKHYSQHKGKDFYEELITFITRSPLVAIILIGEEAVNRVRAINGATSPDDAAEGTIRHRYARSRKCRRRNQFMVFRIKINNTHYLRFSDSGYHL